MSAIDFEQTMHNQKGEGSMLLRKGDTLTLNSCSAGVCLSFTLPEGCKITIEAVASDVTLEVTNHDFDGG